MLWKLLAIFVTILVVLAACGVLSVVVAWTVMLLLNGIAWAIILIVLSVLVGILGDKLSPDTNLAQDLTSLMMLLSFVAYIVLATLCIDGTFRLIPLFW